MAFLHKGIEVSGKVRRRNVPRQPGLAETGASCHGANQKEETTCADGQLTVAGSRERDVVV